MILRNTKFALSGLCTAKMSTSAGTASGERPELDDPIPSRMAALSDSVAVLQSMMGSATKDLVTTLSSNLSILQSVNSMMDQYIQQSLAIRSWMSSTLRLRFRIDNRSAFALQQCRVAVRLLTVKSGRQVPFTISGRDGERFRRQDDHSWQIHELIDFDPDGDQVVEVQFDRFGKWSRYNAVISVSFLSPGSGIVLQREHELGIGILHQCELSYCTGVDGLPDRLDVVYQFSAKAIRDIWKVPDTLGIATRSIFSAKAPDGGQISLHVIELAGENGADIKVAYSSTDSTIPFELIEEEILRMRSSDELGL